VRKSKLKIFPFPYLSSYSKHYNPTSTFSIEVEPATKEDVVAFDVRYHLSNEELVHMIADGKLKVVARMNCPTMGFLQTETFKDGTNRIVFQAPSMDLTGDVDFSAFLVAKEDLDYTNSDLADPWAGMTVKVQKGNAIGETDDRTVTVHHPGDGSNASIFKWVNGWNQKAGDPFAMDLSKDRIVFSLSHEDYLNYKRLQARGESIILTSFLVPAFANILEQMKEPEGSDDEDSISSFNERYQSHQWYQRIFAKYEALFGTDPTHPSVASIVAAQRLLNSPVPNALKFGLQIYKRGVTNDD
jgi:hypothetical protein